MAVRPRSRNHSPGVAEMLVQVEGSRDRVLFAKWLERLNSIKIERANLSVDRRPPQHVPTVFCKQQMIGPQFRFDRVPFRKAPVGKFQSASLNGRFDQLVE